MDISVENHTVSANETIRDALAFLDRHAIRGNTAFVKDDSGHIIGSVTDGDIRRGLLKGVAISDSVQSVMNTVFRFLEEGNFSDRDITTIKAEGIVFLPVLRQQKLIRVLDLSRYKTPLPIDVILMAGGMGKRLMPLTQDTPKPLLKVGSKPIMEHNIDRLISNGVTNFHISVNYLGEQIIAYFADGTQKGVSIGYLKENKPLGTLGSVSLVREFFHDHVLVMNGDLLSNIDFADFFESHTASDSDLTIAATSYHVDVPYAVLEVDEENTVLSFREKPRYNHFCNAGIYLIKASLLANMPQNEYYDATDLIEDAIRKGSKVATYPITGYWLDIGRKEDFIRAQEDVKHIVF